MGGVVVSLSIRELNPKPDKVLAFLARPRSISRDGEASSLAFQYLEAPMTIIYGTIHCPGFAT